MSAFLKGNALGSCGCALVNEYQSVWAVLRYPIGFRGWLDPWRESEEYVRHNDKISSVYYLRRQLDWINAAGEVAYRVVKTFDPRDTDGWFDVSGSFDYRGSIPGDWSDSAPTTTMTATQIATTCSSGCRILDTLSVPYTYADATAMAVAMLDEFKLLDPFSEYINSDDSSVFHFCYPSEGLAAGWPLYSNKVLIYWLSKRSPANNPGPATYELAKGFHNYASPPWYSIQNLYDRFTMATAFNGKIEFSYRPAPYEYANPYLYASKSAVRHKDSIISVDNTVWNPSTGLFETATTALPTPILPGENIFLPKDVGGLGSAQWNT